MSGYPNYPRADYAKVPHQPVGATLNGLAIASMILGIASLLLSCLTGLLGLLLGIIAVVQIQGSNGRLKGTGFAATGIITSLLFSFVVPIVFVVVPAIYATSEVRAAADTANSQTMMREIGTAMHRYADKNFVLPSDHYVNGTANLSWRVMILPYVEGGQALYDQFHLDEPWDSAHNLALADKIPEVFRQRGLALANGETLIKRPIGNGALFDGTENEKIKFEQIKDGTSSTIMLVAVDEANATVWTKPDEYQFSPTNPSRGLGRGHRDQFMILYADGSVSMVAPHVDPENLKAMFTKNGGEMVF